jgi:N-methylhydantoinase B
MAPTLRGPFNSGPSGGTAVAKVAFKYLTLPDYPADEGAFRPLRIVLPPGTMVSAEPPAPMGLWNVPLPTVIDTILKAFSEPLKDRIPAGHLADICSFFWSNLPGRERWVNLEGCPGGWGARPFEDGPSPMKSVSHGDTYKGSLEVEESLSPYQVCYYRLATDSGGPGRYRGGLGIDIAWHFPEGCLAMIELERSKCPPWGLHGGRPGRGNTGEVRLPDGHVAPRAEGDRSRVRARHHGRLSHRGRRRLGQSAAPRSGCRPERRDTGLRVARGRA